MLRLALALCLVGCISKAKEAIAPAPEGVGTMTCREIVEQCDSQCTDPLCVNRCTGEGNQEAQGQHAALLDCGQRSGCTDQACMEQNCPNEIATCMGPELDGPSDQGVPPTDQGPPTEQGAPPADSGAPGQTPAPPS